MDAPLNLAASRPGDLLFFMFLSTSRTSLSEMYISNEVELFGFNLEISQFIISLR